MYAWSRLNAQNKSSGETWFFYKYNQGWVRPRWPETPGFIFYEGFIMVVDFFQSLNPNLMNLRRFVCASCVMTHSYEVIWVQMKNCENVWLSIYFYTLQSSVVLCYAFSVQINSNPYTLRRLWYNFFFYCCVMWASRFNTTRPECVFLCSDVFHQYQIWQQDLFSELPQIWLQQ